MTLEFKDLSPTSMYDTFFFSLVRDLYIAEMEGILGISKPWSLNRWGFRYLDSWKVLFCLKGYERWGQCYEPDLSCLKLRWGSFKDNLGTQWTKFVFIYSRITIALHLWCLKRISKKQWVLVIFLGEKMKKNK